MAVDATQATPVAKQHLAVREGGDIDLGMLDQEAFARVIASGQQQPPPQNHAQPVAMEQQPQSPEEQDDDETGEVDDVTYRPSGVGIAEGADPVWALRMTCLPVLDIFVSGPSDALANM